MQLVRKRMGSQSQGTFARSLGICESGLSFYLRGLQPPSKPLLAALGLVAVVDYRPIAEVQKEQAATVEAKPTKRRPVFRYGDWPTNTRAR